MKNSKVDIEILKMGLPTNGVDNAEQYKPTGPPLIYLKKWMKTRHAIMFRLSNK